MAEEAADEVKVFRRHEEEDAEAPSLADDKKDVAMEEELESKQFSLGAGKGAFHQPAVQSPSFTLPLYSPSYYPMLPFMMNPAAQLAALQLQRLSPAFLMQPLSPSYEMMALSRLMASSPLTGHRMQGAVPLAANVRNAPLSSMNSMLAGAGHSATSSHSTPRRKREKEEHIKKPMNAFMWYMKENRPKLMEEAEFKEKQSAELNKELGKRWQELPKEQQQRYYDLAKKDKEDHMTKYPNWSARENYASHKRKKKKRDRTVAESGEAKKCRARFGVNATDKWCAPCKRKKKCMWAGREDEERGSSQSAQQPQTDSESDLDDDPMMTERDLAGVDHIKMEAQ